MIIRITIKADDITSSNIKQIIGEIYSKHDLYEKAKKINNYTKCVLYDTVEVIATHIAMYDTDYIFKKEV